MVTVEETCILYFIRIDIRFQNSILEKLYLSSNG
jgi:hypothetical protein